MPYSSRHVATVFKVSRETIRSWSNEFAAYLSPTATPPKGKHRLFTEEDIAVLSLVAQMRDQGMTFEDIHASLQSGERGKSTPLSPEDVQAIVAAGVESKAAVEIEYLRRALVQAKEDLAQLEEVRSKLSQTKEEKIRLEAQLDMLREDKQRYQEMIERLSKQLGEEYARGFVAGLHERDNQPKKDE